MTHLRWLLVAVLCCSIDVSAQSQSFTHPPFAGCYQVVSQSWHPSNEDIKLIPYRFELRSESAFEPNRRMFEVRSVPTTGNLRENTWVWQPKRNGFWISLGTGFSGFDGTFERSATGEFVGKLKEWCDSRCGWKKRAGKIRMRQISCG